MGFLIKSSTLNPFFATDIPLKEYPLWFGVTDVTAMADEASPTVARTSKGEDLPLFKADQTVGGGGAWDGSDSQQLGPS